MGPTRSSVQNQETATDDRGLARFRVKSVQTGAYHICVSDVSKPGYVYDADQNLETCEDLIVPENPGAASHWPALARSRQGRLALAAFWC